MAEKDVVIIGAGPGGYVAAMKAARLGGKVTLIEKDELGGICLNWGCMPTKALLRGVEILECVETGKDFGIQTSGATVDFSKLSARKDRAVKTLVSGVGGLMKSNGVEVIKGKARLISPREIRVEDEKKQTTTYSARKVIIATGSVSARLPIPGAQLAGVIDSTGALQLTKVPESMVIIGAGPIGLEFATIFAALGAKVTVLELLPQILPSEDAEIASALEKSLKRYKIEILTKTQVKEIMEGAGGKLQVKAVAGEGEKSFEAEVVLVAVGRSPNVEGLGLPEAGVRVGKKGVEVNSRMETNVPGIYAIGDVTGQWLLAHFAFAQGEVAAENVMGHEAEMDSRVVPRCVYTLPQVASVGLSEKEAREAGHEFKVGRFPFSANGKAIVYGERTGLVKIVAEAKYGEVLGVNIFGPHATDLIGEAVLAMRLEGTAQDVAQAIHPHPTLTEALKEAALDVDGMALHMPPRKKG
jgi:dihydrolipoamide dehydrogenase